MSVRTRSAHTRIRAAAAVIAAAGALALTACSADDPANSGVASTTVTSPATEVVTETADAPATGVNDPSGDADGGNGGGEPAATPQEPTTTPPDHGESSATPADFIGEWTGHTRSLHINADGTGDMSVSIGAADGEKWSLTWTLAGDEIDMTLGSLIEKYGAGLDGSMSAGEQHAGTLQRDSAGVLYLNTTMAGSTAGGTAWCSARYGNSQECGA